MDELKIEKSIIITRNESEELINKDKYIEVTPFWKWALSNLDSKNYSV